MEDNIFGPLTFKEFSYLAGGAGLCFLLYRLIPSTLIAIVFILPVGGFALALAFYRPNNKPFIDMVQSAIVYFSGRKLYIWHKETPLVVTGKSAEQIEASSYSSLPKIGHSKLTDMSFTLATQGKKTGSGEGGIKLKI
jgi:hypothetical protein